MCLLWILGLFFFFFLPSVGVCRTGQGLWKRRKKFVTSPEEKTTKALLFLQIFLRLQMKGGGKKETFPSHPWTSLLQRDYTKQQRQGKPDSFKRLSNTCFHSVPVPGLGFPSHNGNVYLFVSVSALTCFIFFLLLLLFTLSFLQVH